MQEIGDFFKAINDNKNFCVCCIFFLPLQGIEIKTETMTSNIVSSFLIVYSLTTQPKGNYP